MREHLFAQDPQLAAKIPLDEWVFQPGLPASAPKPQSDAFAAIDSEIGDWMKGKYIETSAWSTQEWLHFLRGLPQRLDSAICAGSTRSII